MCVQVKLVTLNFQFDQQLNPLELSAKRNLFICNKIESTKHLTADPKLAFQGTALKVLPEAGTSRTDPAEEETPSPGGLLGFALSV